MRRKTKRKFTWFPTIGVAGPEGTQDEFNGLVAELTVPPNGSTVVAINPMVPDVPMEGDEIDVNAPGQLVQAIGQEYFIERIVGNAYVGVSGPADDNPAAIFPKTIEVGLGLFVARANDADVGGGANTPIGSATLAERIENYSPLGVDAIREPWMFRRTWILNTGRPEPSVAGQPPIFGPNIESAGGNLHTSAFGAPKTNIWYGSLGTGPFVDVRSVRRVGNDERLFVALAARTLDGLFISGQVPNTTLAEGVGLVFDYRVLGRLTRARGKSTF